MGKYLTVLIGVMAIVGGLWAIGATWPLLWTAAKAVLPLLLVLSGVLAVVVGLSEIRDSLTASRVDTPPSQPPRASA